MDDDGGDDVSNFVSIGLRTFGQLFYWLPLSFLMTSCILAIEIMVKKCVIRKKKDKMRDIISKPANNDIDYNRYIDY